MKVKEREGIFTDTILKYIYIYIVSLTKIKTKTDDTIVKNRK